MITIGEIIKMAYQLRIDVGTTRLNQKDNNNLETKIEFYERLLDRIEKFLEKLEN